MISPIAVQRWRYLYKWWTLLLSFINSEIKNDKLPHRLLSSVKIPLAFNCETKWQPLPLPLGDTKTLSNDIWFPFCWSSPWEPVTPTSSHQELVTLWTHHHMTLWSPITFDVDDLSPRACHIVHICAVYEVFPRAHTCTKSSTVPFLCPTHISALESSSTHSSGV